MSRKKSQQPESIYSEQSVLGAVLFEATLGDIALATRLCAVMALDDFSLPGHQMIYRAIREMTGAGRAPDTISVADALDAMKSLEEAGGIDYLSSISGTALTSQFEQHVAIVKDAAARRRAALDLERLHDLISNPPGDDFSDTWKALVRSLGEQFSSRARGPRVLNDVVYDVVDEAEMRSQNPEAMITTTIPDLDKLIGGVLLPGEVIVIAADAGVGKTTLGYYISLANAAKGHGVHIITGEMGEKQVATRMILATLPGISSRNFRSGQIDPDSWPGIFDAADKTSMTSLVIDDATSSAMEIEESIVKAKEILARNGHALKLVMIDYLQQFSVPGIGGDTERVSVISGIIRDLAKKYDIVIMALSAVSRNWLGRSSRPDMHSIRSSGLAVNDASQIWILWRRGTEDEEAAHDLMVSVDKNREGSVGEVVIPFSKASAWLGFGQELISPQYRERLLRESDSDPGMTLDSWKAPDWSRKVIADKVPAMTGYIKANKWLVLCGPNQTGKTHMANALLLDFIQQTGRSGVFVNWLDYSSRLLGNDIGVKEKVMKKTLRVIDDFEKALIKNGDWHMANLLEIMLDSRRKPLIITTNKSPEDFITMLRDDFDNDRGNAIIARLANAVWLDFSDLSPWQVQDDD